MVQSNKILTVSYGTFSCTLEGFDDAFGTMKAIAEYFRDLAAEDRYFGAEPPQPDADMLAHIAQKEIARRVEAHRDETGFVLRAEEPTAVPAAAVTAAAAADAVDELVETQSDIAEAEAEVEAEAEAAPAEDVIAAVEDAEVATEEAEDEAVAEEDDSVSEDASDEDVSDEVEAEEPEAVAEEPAEAEDLSDAEEVQDEAPAEVAELPEGEAKAEDVAAFFADAQDASDEFEDDIAAEDMAIDALVADEDTAEIEEEAPAPAPTSAVESIAAKLQRIRAVVSRSTTPAAPQDFTEDEHADVVATKPIDAMMDEDADLVAPSMSADATELDARLDALDPAEMSDLEVELDETFEDDAAADELDEAIDADADADVLEAEDTLSAILGDAASDAADEEEVIAEVEVTEAQAHVVKVTREEFDAILAADREEAEAALAEEGSDSSLSDEDEADLLRELAEVEAELTDVDMAEDADDDDVSEDVIAEDELSEDDDLEAILAMDEDAADDIEDEDEDDAVAQSDDADEDAEVSRLLDEADDKLDDDETHDRRSEFAHLRAAMAAGKAEEAAGGSMDEAASDGAYRDDLARVVRPRRPEAAEAGERGRRPQDEKPAPLKLVAAQRVDGESAPVQPRRVMSSPSEDMGDEAAEGKMKFAEYADSLGAVELPDLLEAAAAYLSFVEGQEQFSRPQLMTKVRMVEKEDFSREDGLRSFGLLLRDGKIEKTQAGRFTVSDRIGFRPEDVRAAG